MPSHVTRRQLYALVLNQMFGFTTLEPIMQARRCSVQRASQIVGETIYVATGHAARHRNNPAYIAFRLAQKEQRFERDTPESFYHDERHRAAKPEEW